MARETAKARYERVKSWVIDPANRDAVLAAVKVVGGDGHTIFSPDAFPTLPPEIRAIWEVEHKSGSDYKSTIFTDNGPVKGLTGIYGLDMIESIGRMLGAEPARGYFGRGFRCRAYDVEIRKALGDLPANAESF